MTQTVLADPTYVLGRSDNETQHLLLQARLYDAFTRRFLADAGIDAGMRVLDVGTGAGDVAFAELDVTTALGYMRAGAPELSRSLWEWAVQAFAGAGAHTAMAGPLFRAFVAAGLGAPQMVLHAPLGGGAAWPGYDWIAASFRSLQPALEQMGIVSAEELAVESLAARCRAELTELGEPFILLPLVTA